MLIFIDYIILLLSSCRL